MTWLKYQNTNRNFSFGEPKVSFWEGVSGAFNLGRELDNTGKATEYKRQALFERHKQVAKTLGNNAPISYEMSGRAPMAAALSGEIGFMPNNAFDAFNVVSNDNYENKIETARKQNPKGFNLVENATQFKNRIASELTKKRMMYNAIIDNSSHPIIARLAGGTAAQLSDYHSWLPIAMSGGSSQGLPLIKAIGQQFILNAGAEAAAIPFRASERRDIEQTNYGVKEAAIDITTAGLGGTVFEGMGRALGYGFKKAFGNTAQEFAKNVKAAPIVKRAIEAEKLSTPEGRFIARDLNDKIDDAILTNEFDAEDEALFQ